tara:strand:+ start:20 stop:982 length:963 start_codon:yes stop_codon:yes gene_type:complete
MALELPGSFSLSAAAPSLTSTDETVYLLEERKARSSAVGAANVPDHYIKVSKNLNNSVTYHQSNTGAAAGTDDSWSLAALSASSANDAANATLVLPTPTGSSTFQVGQIQIDTSDLDSTLSATAAQQAAFKVMMTVNINNQGVLSASCEVQRAASATDTTLAIVDEAGSAQYLYFDDDSAGGNDTFSQKHASAWSSGDADDVEDKLSQNLSNSSVETAYETEITATKDSIDGENVISSWSLGISAVAADPDSSLTQHARARVGASADPETTSIFQAGDKLIAASSGSAIGASYSVLIDDFNSTRQTIVSGTVYGFFEHSA